MLAWIPNALSLGNLMFGFFSIITAAHAQSSRTLPEEKMYIVAGILILVAAAFDGIDGPIARALGVESNIGVHLDTLGDLTTFGIAPGILMYQLYFQSIRLPWDGWELSGGLPVGMALAAIYPLAAAFRLARFSVAHEPHRFTGLPSPIAGIFIAMIPFGYRHEFELPFTPALLLYVTLAFLMVSNVKYAKPSIRRPKFRSFRFVALSSILGALLIYLGWYWFLVIVFVSYVFSGLLAISMLSLQRLRMKLFFMDEK